MPHFAVILPAAGSSTRFGGGRNKLFQELCGQPVLLRSLAAFTDRIDVDLVVIPTPPDVDIFEDSPPAILNALQHPNVRVCPGGVCRAQSVWNALKCIPASVEWVAVHDAARPLVAQELIDRTLAAAVEHGAAVPALQVHLTIKQATGPLPARVERTVPRAALWAMQTPQIARRDELLSAFETCPIPLPDVTDDVQLIELAGGEVWLVSGDERNLKITTALDLKIAQTLLNE